MGNSYSNINKMNFEDMIFAIKNNCIIINTLNSNEQDCLILNTININDEEKIINSLINNRNNELKQKIVIYGKNCNDIKIYEKYNQLISLGLYNTYIYIGGLFEWLLLQDIYGEESFQTTKNELNILKYKPNKIL